MRNADTPVERLRGEVRRLSDGLSLLYDVLGEIRVDLQWALQNGRVILHLPPSPADESDQGEGEEIIHLTVRLGRALIHVQNQLSEAVSQIAESEARSGEKDSEELDAGTEAPTTSADQATTVLRPSCRVQRSLFDEVSQQVDREIAAPTDLNYLEQDVRRRDVAPAQVVECVHLPTITLFEPGDIVTLDDGTEELEVVAVDDARNTAVIAAMATGQQQTVFQDRLTKQIEPPGLSRDHGSAEKPFTLDDFWTFEAALRRGQLTVQDLCDQYERLRATREAFVDSVVEYSRNRVMSELTAEFGYKAIRGKNARRRNAETIYNAVLRLFSLRAIPKEMPTANLENAVSDVVRTMTQAEIDAFAAALGHADAE